jgi:hypothetical protein
MVVMAIISILVSMTVTGIWGVRRHQAKVEARATMHNMVLAMINLKRNYDYDPMIPVGVWTGGRTTLNTNGFVDPNRNFDAAGITAGDTLYLLGGPDAGQRGIGTVSGSGITVDGDPFTSNETDLEYFIVRGSGTVYPSVDLAREVDPNNEAWAGTFTPHLNARKIRYYTCKTKRIQAGSFCDPWGHPYTYVLAPETGKIVEKIACRGVDGQEGTMDDIEEVITEIPFGE